MNPYDVLLYTPHGKYLRRLNDNTRVNLTRSENQLGTLSIDLPTSRYSPLMFRPDYIIDVMRNVGGRDYLVGESHFLIRKIVVKQSEITLECEDGMCILDTRVVAYDQGDPQAEYTAVIADDAMKAVVDENLGASATDADRDLSSVVSIAYEHGLGPIISKEFSGRRVLSVLQEMAKAAFEEGTFVAFDMIANGPGKFLFKTYCNMRGVDHSVATGSPPVEFSLERGNLINFTLTYDYSDERTVIYAQGTPADGAKQTYTATDAVRMARSPFNRREEWTSVQSTTLDAVTSDAKMLLDEARPKILVEGEAVQIPGCLFDVHYRFGDLVTVSVHGLSISCRVKAFMLSLTQGRETVSVNLSNAAE